MMRKYESMIMSNLFIREIKFIGAPQLLMETQLNLKSALKAPTI